MVFWTVSTAHLAQDLLLEAGIPLEAAACLSFISSVLATPCTYTCRLLGIRQEKERSANNYIQSMCFRTWSFSAHAHRYPLRERSLLPNLVSFFSNKLKLSRMVCWLVFTCPIFLFAPFVGHPASSPFLGTFSPFSPPRKVLCSVEHRAQRRAWRGAALGWTSPQSSGRKLLPREKKRSVCANATCRGWCNNADLLNERPTGCNGHGLCHPGKAWFWLHKQYELGLGSTACIV